MNGIKKTFQEEMRIFWEWAKTTPIQYSKERGLGEWECNYSNWMELYSQVDLAINELNIEYNLELAELVIQVLAIDNESELVLEKIENQLNNPSIFIEQVIDSIQPQAKWQMAELLKKLEVEYAVDKLVSLINDKDKYVKRRALLSLNIADKQEAKDQAKIYLNDEDEYLRRVSLEIVNS